MEVGSRGPSNLDSNRKFAKAYDSALREFIASSATGAGTVNLVSSADFPDHVFKEPSQSANASNAETSDTAVTSARGDTSTSAINTSTTTHSQFPILPSYESSIPPAGPNVQSGLQGANVQEAFDDLIVLEDGMVTSASYTNIVSRDAAEQFQQSHFPPQEPSASAPEGFAPVVSQGFATEKTDVFSKVPVGTNAESLAFSSVGGLCLPVGNSVLPEVSAVATQAEIQPPQFGHFSLNESITKPIVTEASIDQPLVEELPGPGEVIEPSAEWPTSEGPQGPGEVVEPYISQQAMHESSGPTETHTKDPTTSVFEPPEIQAVVDELPASLREANVLEPFSVPTVAEELPVLTTGLQDDNDALTINQAHSDQLIQGEPSEQGLSEENAQTIKGQKVRKKFGNKYYLGDIVDYDPETKWFKIIYEDGDEEDLEMAEVKAILPAPSTLPSASKKKRSSDVGDGKERNKSFKKQRKEQDTTQLKKSKGSRKNKGKVSTSKKNGGPARRLDPSKAKSKVPRKSINTSDKGKLPITRGQETGNAVKQIGLKRRANSDEVVEAKRRHSKAAAPAKERTALVGRTFKKDFNGTLYGGVIEKYDKTTKYYKVKYEDGDQEDLEWDELEPLLNPVDNHTDDSKQLEAKPRTLKSKAKTQRAK